MILNSISAIYITIQAPLLSWVLFYMHYYSIKYIGLF